jgi:hypothetical protein
MICDLMDYWYIVGLACRHEQRPYSVQIAGDHISIHFVFAARFFGRKGSLNTGFSRRTEETGLKRRITCNGFGIEVTSHVMVLDLSIASHVHPDACPSGTAKIGYDDPY